MKNVEQTHLKALRAASACFIICRQAQLDDLRAHQCASSVGIPPLTQVPPYEKNCQQTLLAAFRISSRKRDTASPLPTMLKCCQTAYFLTSIIYQSVNAHHLYFTFLPLFCPLGCVDFLPYFNNALTLD